MSEWIVPPHLVMSERPKPIVGKVSKVLEITGPEQPDEVSVNGVWYARQPEWQPIQTAPRDGSEVDLWTYRDHSTAGHQERRWCYARWTIGQFQGRDAEWVIEEEDGEMVIRDWTPTHWCYPQPPPSAETDHTPPP